MASCANTSVNGGESEENEDAGRRQIAANGGGPSGSGGGGGDDTCRLLALPAGLLPLVADRLNLKDRLSLRACCRATRADVQLGSLRVRRASLVASHASAGGSFSARPPHPDASAAASDALSTRVRRCLPTSDRRGQRGRGVRGGSGRPPGGRLPGPVEARR
jgi:hypothetical protein